MTDAPELKPCPICKGSGNVAVGWTPVAKSTVAIRVERDPCPGCTPPPHTFLANKIAVQIRAIHERDGQ